MDFPQLSIIIYHHQIIQSVIEKLPIPRKSIFQTLSEKLQLTTNQDDAIFQSVTEKL